MDARNSSDTQYGENDLPPHLRRAQERKEWDIFEDPPIVVPTGSMVDTKWIDFGEKAGKVVAYILAFTIVLGGAVVSKGTLMFMTSQLGDYQKPYCSELLDRNRQFAVKLPEIEKTAWIWALVFTYAVPQLGTFLRSLRMVLYKTWNFPKLHQFAKVFLTESCSAVGNAILIFAVLPKLDAIKGVMLLNGVSIVPAILNLTANRVAKTDQSVESRLGITDMLIQKSLDILAIVMQASVFVVWPLLEDDPDLWLIPAAGFLISLGWWENFIPRESPIPFLSNLTKNNRKFTEERYFTYLIVSLWKCAIFIGTMMVVMNFKVGNEDQDVTVLYTNFLEAFDPHNITIKEIAPISFSETQGDAIEVGTETTVLSDNLTPVWLFVISVCSSYLSYIFGKFACKTYLHQFSYAFAINLTVPVALTALIAMCATYTEDPCAYTSTIPPYLFFNSPPMYYLQDFLGQQHSWIWFLWLISQAWITSHLWSPKCEKMAKTERLFVRPMYEGFLIDQDLAMNRRINDAPTHRIKDKKNAGHVVIDDDDDDELYHGVESGDMVDDEDTTPQIYACATMWHESPEEMMEFLKSILRMDEDYSARKIVKSLNYHVKDYYEFETHIFFDDAFERSRGYPQVNEYVQKLVKSVNVAVREIHKSGVLLKPPRLSTTPYGGQLEWILPGKTKMIAHLKDSQNIRKKKRWSQIMYMYYLLGYKLMANEKLSTHQKVTRSTHTYLLALDGDIDFQPKAVHLLVDLMKKDLTVGAACGRIHPLGSGVMAWYQMFEYAIGHWLQKATEHVIGCVLCSPGCFSLFRGEALMDDNVMRRYATESTEALHYVQFDQGEDRWLCTLLLQRGYRVEYSAASDAYTHCPEGFNEFFKQRRRWMPSTTANIFDLLATAKATIKANTNISQLYIVYQLALMVGTVLGPGTIFLMLVGSFVAAFQMSQWNSFMWNLIPILIFMVVCATIANDDIQLFIAAILSGVYSLVMMAVLVGVILQINSDGILAPSSLFFFCVAGEMIITALMHPKELNCLKFGVVYYVTVPCMYMILVIYSVFNMNNVSWGTRETAAPAQPQKDDKQQKKEEPTKTNKILRFLGAGEETAGGMEVSLGNLFRCLCCTLAENVPLKMVLEKLDRLEDRLNLQEQGYQDVEDDNKSRESEDGTAEIHESIYSETSWCSDEFFENNEVDFIKPEEVSFWEGIIEKYLKPIDQTPKDKEDISNELKNLRDKMVIAFFMINAIFVLTIFLLTLKKDIIFIPWPLSPKANFTYIIDSDEVRIYKDYLQLEPIGILFVVAFAVLLIVQFIAMLIHRLQTFCQIISNTSLNIFTKPVKNVQLDELFDDNPVEFVKIMMKKNDDESEINLPPDRRPTIHHLITRRPGNLVTDLEEQFNNNLDTGEVPGIPRLTMARLQERRRQTVFKGRPSMGPNVSFGASLPRPSMASVPRPSMAANAPRMSMVRSRNSGVSRPNSNIITFDNQAFVGDNDEFGA